VDDLLAAVIDVAKRHLPPDEPRTIDHPDVDLRSIGLGSLKMVEFMVDLERSFAVRFPEAMVDTATFRTPRTIAEAITTIRGGG
jgi:acyl carrier protein